jgi:hypothetical protein
MSQTQLHFGLDLLTTFRPSNRIWFGVETVLTEANGGLTTSPIFPKDHRGSFTNIIRSDDDRGLNDSRGLACEYAAFRFILHLSGREAIDYLLYELPRTTISHASDDDEESGNPTVSQERSPLFGHSSDLSDQTQGNINGGPPQEEADEFASSFDTLNSLEIAAVVGAKKFLSQRCVLLSKKCVAKSRLSCI